MTFDTIATSAHDGRPVDLYWFSVGGSHYRYCSNDKPVLFQGSTYNPLSIKAQRQKLGTRIEDTLRKITVPRTADVARRVRRSPPPAKIRLVIYRVHVGSDVYRVSWSGYVLGGEQKKAAMELRCQSTKASLKSNGLRRRIGKGCSNVLYGPQCGLEKADFLVLGVADVVSGLDVTVSALSAPDGTYGGGLIEWTNTEDSIQEYSWIQSQVGNVLTLVWPPYSLPAGSAVKFYRGCDHSLDICVELGNELNYGGEPYMPEQAPGNGTTLF